MSLLFNMLSRLVIAFLPRDKCLLISWLQSPSTVILEPKKMKSDTVSTFSPFICHEMIEPDATILIFWMLSFKPAFSLSFTFIKKFFSSSSLCALRMVSSVYLRLLIFLLTVLIPACAHPAWHFTRCLPIFGWNVPLVSLLFKMLSRLVRAFLSRSKHLLISWLQSPSTVTFGVQENKICHCFHCFPIYLPWSDGTGCHDLSFLDVEF